MVLSAWSYSIWLDMKRDGFCRAGQLGNGWLALFISASEHAWYLEGILAEIGTLQVKKTTHMTIQAQMSPNSGKC